jgi:Divergent InlB B-repeat domain
VKATSRAIAPPLSQTASPPPQAAGLGSVSDDDNDRPTTRTRRFVHPVQDSVLQVPLVSGLSSLSTNSGLNMLGLGFGFPGYALQANVPDTNGAAGPTQFVQWVNESFAVFNKSNGSLAYGPTNGNVLWQALGGPCATYNNLDPIVQFDKLANRWVMMMPIFHQPSYLCVAVSTTADFVNSTWNLYAFLEPTTSLCGGCRPMPDYPKWAVWPDGYYVTYNQGGVSQVFIGAAACVVDRKSMLSGAAATMQCFTKATGTSFGTLLPADPDGASRPPAGSPAYFLSFDYNDQSLDLWQFHVDWTTPANSTFTGPTNIPVAPFAEACGETVTELNYTTGACIPQAGTSGMLDSYADRLMYRLAYRNFGTHQSLVANHTVQIGTGSNQTGIRWYELQNTGSGFGLYQQGTYAPDSSYRWMGSIAMDKIGDIALGYSVSGSTLNPSIRYTGRMPSDPLGQMASEIDVLSSAGVSHSSQTNTYRWGDYSSLAVDPIDDCTFWYTTEYVPTASTSNNHWGTRIASFSFPSCTQTYVLTVNEVGHGTVTGTDGAINCTNGSGTCSATYGNGSSVTLNAAAAGGWTFTGWSGACSGGNPCNLVMASNLTATASFATAVPSYTLTVNEAGQGTVTSTDGAINCINGSGTCSVVYSGGNSVSLNATAASGWTFTGWGGACSGRNPCNLVMTSNLTTTAAFVTTPSWTIVHKTSKGGAITSLTIPATGSGHLIAVAMMFNGTTSVSGLSDNVGNTYVSASARAATGSNSVEIWYAQNSIAGATVITPSFLTAPTVVQISTWEVSGILFTPPDAKNSACGSVTLNNTPGPAVTTTQVGDFIISVLFAINTAFTAISSGNEFTNDFTTYGNGWAHITSNLSSTGTHQASWVTSAPTGKYCASTVAFAP